jgi:tRNA pseudouridine32 synthase / 23S rRNA pseudouridine746 synthase
MSAERRFTLKKTIDTATPQTCCDYLAEHAGLSKGKVKDAMVKGAVWLGTQGGKRRRLRRATTVLQPGDRVEFYYDADLLRSEPPAARCVDDLRRYSVWFKPAGLMAQGTEYGDHCALLRQVENYFHPRRPGFLVHRLDREAAGLMLVAHDGRAAARLSALFRDHRITKDYRVRVRGEVTQRRGEIDLPLDGKPALTRFTVAGYDPAADATTLEVSIATGRLHQIRRHFAMIGHGVLGDPKYGTGNKNREGLQLAAVGLHFRCPFTAREMAYAGHDIFKKGL